MLMNRVVKGRRSLFVRQFKKFYFLFLFFPLKKSMTQNFRMYARLETVRALYGFSLESVVFRIHCYYLSSKAPCDKHTHVHTFLILV